MRLALIVALASLLSACPDPTSPESRITPSASVGSRPIRGGVLRVAIVDDVDALDPHRATRPSSWFFARALHRGLYAYPDMALPDGARPRPDIASGMPVVAPNGLSVRIELRDDVRFGAPENRAVHASDVQASLERIVRAGAGIARALDVIAGAPDLRRGRARQITGIATPDARTVVLTLRRRAPELSWILAQPQIAIIPADVPRVGSVTASAIAPTGPYRIDSYEPERALLLKRNPAWRAASDPTRAANADRIDVRIGGSATRAARDVGRGAIDVLLDAGPPDAGFPAAPRGATVASASSGCLRYLFLNTRAEPFSRRAVRLAGAAAVRRASLKSPEVVLATSILPPTVWGSGGPLAVTESTPARQRISATLTIGASRRDRVEARAVARSLARAGIDLRIKEVLPAVLYPHHYERGLAQAGLATWCADWPGLAARDMLAAFLGSGQASYAGLKRDAIALPSGADEATLTKGAHGADLALQKTGAIIPLTWPSDRVLLAARVRGFVGSPMFPRGDPTAFWLALAP